MKEIFKKYATIILAGLCFVGILTMLQVWTEPSIWRFWCILGASVLMGVCGFISGYILGAMNTQDRILRNLGAIVKERSEEIAFPPTEGV